MKLARDGIREIVILTVLLAGGAAAAAAWSIAAAVVLLALWLAGLAFFRVPKRTIPSEPSVLIAPADGRVTDITPLAHDGRIGGPAVRIGIFLSVLDVHVNRSPCSGRVASIDYKPGKFLDARHPDCGTLNESNTIVIEPDAPMAGPLVVRQVAGLIARRIVCRLSPGQRVERGELFGMIKFGSRTELIVPANAGLEAAVVVGAKVAGGHTILMRHRAAESPEDSHDNTRSTETKRTAPV